MKSVETATQLCPECGEELHGKGIACPCGWTKNNNAAMAIAKQESVQRRRQNHRLIEAFLDSPKGIEIKAWNKERLKNFSMAMARGREAVKAIRDAWAPLPDDECFCEAGIVFRHEGRRYKLGNCDRCHDPQRNVRTTEFIPSWIGDGADNRG